MAKKNEQNVKPKEVDEVEKEDEGLSSTLLEMADFTQEQMEALEEHLAGTAKKPIGANIACNGFFKKCAGAQLIGRVVASMVKQSDLNPDKEDHVIFVQGAADYATDAMDKRGKKVVIKAGRYYGTFGYQIDAGGAALGDVGRGTRIHLKVADMVDISGGRTRWTYDFIRTS